VIGMVADPELPPDDRRHPLGGPDLATEAERFGAPRQQGRQRRPLLIRQFRGRAGCEAPLQRLESALASTAHPLADGPGGHPERLRNRLLTPALLLQLPCAQPSAFPPLGRRLSLGFHTSRHRTDRTSFSFLCGDQ
jgi:hypothetical protein